jgi:predicted kinase
MSYFEKFINKNPTGFSFYRAIDVMKDWPGSRKKKIHILSIISMPSVPAHHGKFYDYFRSMDASCTADAEYCEQPTVTLLVGPPACGKSTWVENNKYDHKIVSRDEVVMGLAGDISYTEAFDTVDHKKVDQLNNHNLSTMIVNEQSFIVDQTNMSRKSRRKILSQVGNNYWKKAVVFAIGYEEIFRRRIERKDKVIPDYVMKNMIGNFMVPMYDEFDEIEWVFDEG